jgi:hypothetical protein
MDLALDRLNKLLDKLTQKIIIEFQNNQSNRFLNRLNPLKSNN